MILLCGIPSETPLAMVADAIIELGHPVLILNQRQFMNWDIALEVCNDGMSGWLRYEGRTISLPDFNAIYVRLMDYRELPEYKDGPSAHQRLCGARHGVLHYWLELTPACVLNRTASSASNSSKPYQSQKIEAAGFAVPPTLITNDPTAVCAFRKEHGRIIYKSISSMRSIVREFTEADVPRLDKIRWCPTQFQSFVEGTNVRVHVAGEAVFATEILSDAADYRYAAREGATAELRAREIDADLAIRCRTLAHSLDLPLAGIDLKFAPDGRIFCFEVNPSPAFSFYESHTGQPIARAIAEHLMGVTKD